MAMNIRTMTLQDVPAIHKMAKDEEGFQVAESEGSCFWSIEQLERWVQNGDDVLLVAEIEEEIAGFELSVFHRPTGKVFWENELVTPKFRGRGIARALEKEMETRLKAMGATYLHFLVKEENPFLSSYETRGFERGETFVWFAKRL